MINPTLFISRALITGALVAAGVGQAMAANAVLDTYSLERLPQNEGSLIVTLEGSGFGAKRQAAPILWLFGDDVRQNGKKFDYPSFSFGDSIAPNEEARIWDRVTGSVVYHPDSRYPGLSHSYFTGNIGTVRKPVAFGGSNPPYSDKIYLSARIKPVEAWHGFRSIGFENMTGQFDLGPSRYEAGEDIALLSADGISKTIGRLIYANPETNLITLETRGGWGKSDLDGATVVGQKTGSKMTLNASIGYHFAIGSKYFRMWSGDRPGMFNTLGINRLSVGYRDSSGSSVAKPQTSDGSYDKGYDIPDMTSKLDWRLLETFVDQETNILRAYIDIDNGGRRYVGNMDISDTFKFMDRAPTISQLGLVASGGREVIDAALYFGEIYFDNTPKRIMVSDQPTYDEAGAELELQFPIEWTNDKLTFELRAGALDINEKLYLYIFDENSNPNKKGLEICVTCKLTAPNNIELNIE